MKKLADNEIYHFVGIGGIGMSGLARMLSDRGAQVAGSDAKKSYVTENLETLGIRVYIGHSKDNIRDATQIVVSSDIPSNNPELQEAYQKKIPIRHRSELLSDLMRDSTPLLVAGTHGKTTTSALLAHCLLSAHQKPSFAIGGLLLPQSINSQNGSGQFFVAEADESDGTFLRYSYLGAIVTNIGGDHLAHYGSQEALIAAFSSFLEKSTRPEHLFFCKDDPILDSLCIQGVSYGFHDNAELRAIDVKQTGWKQSYDIRYHDTLYQNISIPLIGKHNCRNSLAVFGLLLSLGLDEQTIRQGFSTFQGVKRRMEKRGFFRDVLIVDDYGHHPTEIETTLDGLRKAEPGKKIICIYQPHRFSRMKYCMEKLQGTFAKANYVIVTDLFSAGEDPISGITTDAIVDGIKKDSSTSVLYIPRKDLAQQVKILAGGDDIVITFGAGDITYFPDELQRLQ